MSDNSAPPITTADTSSWYYLRNEQKIGPVTIATLQQLAANEQLLPSDQLIPEGSIEWVTAASVPGLFADATPTPPPVTNRPGAPAQETKDAWLDQVLASCAVGDAGTVSHQTQTQPNQPDSATTRTREFPAIPGYEILGVLGRGGMGVVYKARQTALKRLVALKMILSGGHAGEHELARFRLEAEAVARMQHPNIVQIYDISEHDGRPYFSLEFVDGGPLSAHLDGTPQPPQQAAQLVSRHVGSRHVLRP